MRRKWKRVAAVCAAAAILAPIMYGLSWGPVTFVMVRWGFLEDSDYNQMYGHFYDCLDEFSGKHAVLGAMLKGHRQWWLDRAVVHAGEGGPDCECCKRPAEKGASGP